MNQTIWTPRFFTWKPSNWGENHRSFTNFKFYFARFDPGWGNNPLQFTWRRTKTLFIQLLLGTNRKGLQPLQAYNVGPSTTLPPYNDKIERRRERLKTDLVQALLTNINVTVSKWETHFDWQAPQDKTKTKQDSTNKRTKERRQA